MASSDALSLGLDDIIRQNRTNRRGGPGGRGGFRGRGGRGGNNTFRTRGGGGIPRAQEGGRYRQEPYGNGFNASRGGGERRSGVNSTTKLLISNLDHGVTTNDIQELFEDVGAVRASHVHYDENGRSLGTAEVIYERRVDAVAAQQKYNTLKLDGRPMDIKLVGGTGNSFQMDRVSSGNGGGRNQRGGFRNNNQRSNGSQNPGRNNRTRGGKQQNGGGNAKEDVTAENLDAELEAYRAESKQKK